MAKEKKESTDSAEVLDVQEYFFPEQNRTIVASCMEEARAKLDAELAMLRG